MSLAMGSSLKCPHVKLADREDSIFIKCNSSEELLKKLAIF